MLAILGIFDRKQKDSRGLQEKRGFEQGRRKGFQSSRFSKLEGSVKWEKQILKDLNRLESISGAIKNIRSVQDTI